MKQIEALAIDFFVVKLLDYVVLNVLDHHYFHFHRSLMFDYEMKIVELEQVVKMYFQLLPWICTFHDLFSLSMVFLMYFATIKTTEYHRESIIQKYISALSPW